MKSFIQRKKDVLSKKDKSSIGEWDKPIINLCNKINSFEEYYTTSSCSGRALLMIDKEKKQEGLFLKVYHDVFSFDEFKDAINEVKDNFNVKFKLDPCILHVACKNIDEAQKLYDKAKLAGWKKSGLISFDSRVILELNSSERLEFPVIEDGEILVSDAFLRKIVSESNQKLKKSWLKIEKLQKSLE